MDLAFLPKLLLQHDSSPDSVLEDVHGAFLDAVRRRTVQTSVRPQGDGVAVALGQRLVLLRGLSAGSSSAAAGAEFVTAVDAPEAVTALCWMAAGGQSTGECVLLGTSEGYLQLHCASTGALLLRQRVHHTAAVAAAVRWSGTGTDPEDLSEDVTLTCADAVVRLPAWEVWAAVRWHAGRAASRGQHWWSSGGGGSGGAAAHQLAFAKFSLPKSAGPRSAALCLGPPPPTLYAALAGRAEPPHRLRILTVGSGPPLAAYEAEEASSPGLLSLVSDLASTTAASLLGRARSYVPRPAAAAGRSLLGGLARQRSGTATPSSGSSAADLQQAGQGGQVAQQGRKQERIPGEPATVEAAVWDEKRAVTQMALSPCGRWAACCDSLGRVLLVDVVSTLIVRMLKGYREAQVAWLVCGSGSGGSSCVDHSARSWAPRAGSASSLGGGSSAPSSLRSSTADLAALHSPERQQQHQQQQQQGEESWGLGGVQQRQQQAAGPGSAAGSAFSSPEQWRGRREAEQSQLHGPLLAIYAPRRGSVELWEPHSLARIGSVQCSTQLGLLLQQPARRADGGGAALNRCMLLDATTLVLHDLTDPLHALL